nr:cytochrome b [Lymnaea stagnalis]
MQKMRLIESMSSLPTPLSISIWWNGGSILGLLLVLQILTGFFLSMHYTSDIMNTFASVMHISRDVPYGWMFRSFHANGASFFFLFIYLHIGRGLYYQSFMTQPRTWLVGTTIFLVSMATAFLGYVLPWGQMSFWGATVITNLMSAIPYFGPGLVEWIWGSFSVGQSTLTRFYSLHFIMPFVIGFLSAIHIYFLHEKGSTNPLGDINHISKSSFHPYFSLKDFVGFMVVLLALSVVALGFPNWLGDPENFSMANMKVTPTHIQPEWYFLFAYAILRSIPSKLGGVIALVMSIFVLYFLPLMSFNYCISSSFSPMFQVFFWVFSINFILLTWLGACPIEEPYMSLAVPCTILYFCTLFILMWSPTKV